MRLKDLFRESFREEPDIDISVLLPDMLLTEDQIALESIWQNSSRSGWSYRIDPPDPRIPLMRHVHIAKDKHKNSKNMQASWNEDGTRHDKKSFNDPLGSAAFVRELAKEVLGIPSNITLENIDSESISINENVTFSEDGSEAYLRFSVSA